MADHDISKMKVADLKRELKIRGLNVTGNKNDLVERLQSALIEGDVFDDTAISEELLDDNDDVLNDDELDEETKYLNSTSVQDEDAILSSPKGSSSSKSPENPSETSTSAANAAQQKKVVLKRKLLTSVSLTESEPTKTPISAPSSAGSTESKVMKLGESTSSSVGEKASEANDSNGSADGNVVKLSQLSMKERLEMPAKKFGTPVSGDAAKLARAEQFGLPSTASAASTTSSSGASASGGAAVTVKSAADVELLKKRAERCGGSVSNTMVKIELNEKRLKRQERFGATTTISGKVESKPISTQEASDYAEKAKLRLERFKTTA